MIYINLLMITFIIMYVIDNSGLLVDISKFLYEKINKKEWLGQIISFKPFTCSSCMIFHTIWIYLIIINNYPIIYSLFLATIFSTFINITLNRIYNKIIKLIFKIK